MNTGTETGRLRPLAPAWYATGITAMSLMASLFLPKKSGAEISTGLSGAAA